MLIRLVEVAVSAAVGSEERRTRSDNAPKQQDLPGWGLGRELLSRWKLPVELLPERRDAWLPKRYGKETRRRASMRRQAEVWHAARQARQLYDDALQDARGEYFAQLLRTSGLWGSDDAPRRFDPDAESGQALRSAEEDLTEKKKQHLDLRLRAEQAEKSYETLMRKRRVRTEGKWLSLPLPADSSFWSVLATALKQIFETTIGPPGTLPPHVRAALHREGTQHQGHSSLTLVRRTLATVAPAHHLDTSHTDVRNRVGQS